MCVGLGFAKAALRRSKDLKDTEEATLGTLRKVLQREEGASAECSRTGTQPWGGWRGVQGEELEKQGERRWGDRLGEPRGLL